jgi:hypothetical protein
MLQIKKAAREKIWLKVAVIGPTGSGKTWGAISVAKGLSDDGRVCVIDTENASASYYADRWDFDVIALGAPFSVERYLEAFQVAVDAGYTAIVIDSLTHVWAGQGGILSEKAQTDKKGGNSFANWQEYKAAHGSFVDNFLTAKAHVIATIRSKMAYEMTEYTEAGRTKKEVVKLGMGPVQAEGIEYEFGVVFDLAQKTHMADSTKDRTGLFDKRTFLLTEAVGKELKAWRDGGAELAPDAPAPAPAPSKPATAPIAKAPAPPAPKEPTREQIAENNKDSFIENVELFSEKERVTMESLIIQHNVPIEAFLTYLASKKGYILLTEDGAARLDRMIAAKAGQIIDILSDSKRRHNLVTAINTEQKTA